MNSESNSSDQHQHQHQPMYVPNSNTTPVIGMRKRQQPQPLLSCTAHIFQIDPITKKSWIPSSTTALPVSFFYDGSRGLYRIICTDGPKTLVNSTLLPGMNFTKTSQKFGQWSDKQTSIVYGLGFNTEMELEKFDEQFHDVVKATLRTGTNSGTNAAACIGVGSPAKHLLSNGNGAMNDVAMRPEQMGNDNSNSYGTIERSGGSNTMDMNANAISYQMNSNGNVPNKISPNNNTVATMANNLNNANAKGQISGFASTMSYLNSPAKVLRLQQQHQLMNGTSNLNSGNLQNIYNSPKHAPYNLPLSKLIGESIDPSSTISSAMVNGKPTPEAIQLKNENEKLRLALQQSSANSKIWEYELSALKQNNAKLTTALQECNINVEDWKHQLAMYKEENQSLRLKILDLEADVGGVAPGHAPQHNATNGESELGKQLDGLRNKVNYYSKLLNDKDEQINCLKFKTGSLENGRMEKLIYANGNEIQNGGENILWTNIQTVHSQLQTTFETQDFQRKVLDALAVQLSTKLSDLTLIQDKMKETLDSALR